MSRWSMEVPERLGANAHDKGGPRRWREGAQAASEREQGENGSLACNNSPGVVASWP